MLRESAVPITETGDHSATPSRTDLATMALPLRPASPPSSHDGDDSDSITPAGEAGCCATTIAAGHDAARAGAAEAVSCPGASPGGEKQGASADAETGRVRLVRAGNTPFSLPRGSRLENNLSWVVGCLELANAGDFAANVWNQLPVPLFAAVLMGVGGTLAAFMSVFAFRDARRAWNNIRFLRRQRRQLRLQRQQQDQAPGGDGGKCSVEPAGRALDVLLAVSFRELGGEVINRWVMDVLMGFGAVLISAGTYMAIGGGTSDQVFAASNLLSGWLGNTPIAAFGLVNSAWAIYIWCKAQAHVCATRRLLPGSRAASLVKRRSRNVQVFCVINGSATILGGAGSMLTSIYWWGYVILIPVVISSIFCNLWWRWRVGYTRSQAWPNELRALEPSELATSLEFAARAEILLREQQEQEQKKKRKKNKKHREQQQQQQQITLLHRFVPDPSSLPDVLAFFHQHALFEDLCLNLASDPRLRDALCGANPGSELEVGPVEILALPAPLHPDVLNRAQECIGRVGQRHFRNRERHLAELLGTYCTIIGTVDLDMEDSSEKQR
ncbi:integral membrane protein [Hirsutella rhossiliensis]|uniref:Integral membrane protein n=1 Tax=Hirsutella rhossiliensis TaxID=111463 RepID=A0A9P8SEV4_9HYPO|nr:uncharacterized protein HRG_08368 [Hirsutella rhossiliensis]KAH0960213.1 integral membrane protein [Hirsutella rhossiliensis]